MVIKRYLTDVAFNFEDLSKLVLSMAAFFLIKKLYSINGYTMRFVPFLIAVFSYYNHSIFIFKGTFDKEGDTSSVEMNKD